MSSKRAGRQARDLILCGLLFALAWVLAPTRVAANPGNARPLKQDEASRLPWYGGHEVRTREKTSTLIPQNTPRARTAFLLARIATHPSKTFPTPQKFPQVQCVTCHEEEVKSFATSAHSLLGETACSACHGNVHDLVTTGKLMPAKCVECHADEVKQFNESIHGQAVKNGDPDAPKCSSCQWPDPHSEARHRNGFARCSKELGYNLRNVPQRRRFSLAAQDSRGASGRILSAERARPRHRRRKRQSARIATTVTAITISTRRETRVPA